MKILKNSYSKEVIQNVVYKGIGISLNFLIVPLSINKIGSDNYGIWVTILSVISWLNISDLGVGNFLRNKISKEYGKNNIELLKSIKIIFTFMLYIGILLSGILFLIYTTNLLKYIININEILDRGIFYSLVIGMFIINFIFGMYKSIAYGLSKSYYIELSNIISLFLIVILLYFSNEISLVQLSFIYFLGTILNNIILIFLIIRENKIFFFGVDKLNLFLIKEIINNGMDFFIIQLSAIVLFSTDNIIINNILGSSEVSKYSVLSKIFDSGLMVYSLLMIPLWSRTAKAYSEKNYNWIRKMKKKLLSISIIFSLGTLLISIFIKKIINIWIGDNIFQFDNFTILIFCLYNILVYINAIFSNILNGMGILKFQAKISAVVAMLNIPLSIYFAKNLNFGIGGVKLATFICILGTLIFSLIQVEKELRK